VDAFVVMNRSPRVTAYVICERGFRFAGKCTYDSMIKQTWTANLVLQCVLFSLDYHHLPSAKNCSFSRHISLEFMAISGVIFGRGNLM